jgi:hypothetical protein
LHGQLPPDFSVNDGADYHNIARSLLRQGLLSCRGSRVCD